MIRVNPTERIGVAAKLGSVKVGSVRQREPKGGDQELVVERVDGP